MKKWIAGMVAGCCMSFISAAADKPAESQRRATLVAALADADRLEVVPVTYREPQPKPFEIKGKEKIAGLLKLLDFNDEESGFHCMCDGDHLITLYKGAEKTGQLSHHHFQSLRWYDKRWKGDALFQPGVSEAWCAWFKENGYGAFEDARQEAIAEAKAQRAQEENFQKPFPAAALAIYDEVSSRDGGGLPPVPGDEEQLPTKDQKRFLAACGDPAQAGLMICKSLGSLAGGYDGAWNTTTFREQFVIGAFHGIEQDRLPAVFESAVKDEVGAMGAARLFFWDGFSSAIAEKERLELAASFGKAVIRKDYHGNVAMLLRDLDGMWSPGVESLFASVADGSLVPSAGPTEKDGEPGARAAAILILARHGNRKAAEWSDTAEPALTRTSDRAALAIARAWAGDSHAMKPEYFKIGSYTLGLGGLAYLEDQGDREALDMVITSGLEHPWAGVKIEGVLTVQRMTGKTWYKGQPNEREDSHVEEIKAWWAGAKDSWVAPSKLK